MSAVNDQGGTLVVLTALEVEYQAVRTHLAAVQQRRHPSGTLFDVGQLPGTPWQVALAEIGDGNQAAAVLTERAIALFHPRALFFVGVAGAIKDDIQLGDVVVATHVYAYHGGKDKDGEHLSRPRVWPAPHDLEQRAKALRRTGTWTTLLPQPSPDRPPGVHLKPIAAGEVVLNSAHSPLREQLRRHYQDASAIEMESAGAAQAAHLNHGLPALTVRGISDKADGGKRDADAGGWQTAAARHAAAFTLALIHTLPADAETRPPRPAGRDLHVTQEVAAASMPVTVLHTLPRDVAAFTGRQTEVEQILTAAKPSKAVAIHTVDGMPGVGKTALVIHAAHQLTGRYPDGQVFLRLHAHTPGQRSTDPAEVLAEFLLSLGMDPRNIPDGLEARAALWRDRLAGKRVLLVLDDAADQAQVEPLLPGGEGCLVLVTSRRRLAALDGAVPLPLDTLPPKDAVLLFTRLAHRTPVTAAHAAAVARIVELCGHLPLAIALLAGRFAHHPQWQLAQYAEEFAETRDRLSELAAGDRAVKAAFDMSYKWLPAGRQRIFRRLGLHPGPEIDAHATAALDDIPFDQARDQMEALYTDHLVNSPAVGRYRLHDLIRVYARTLAARDSADDQAWAAGRLLDYYQHTAETADQYLTDAPHPTAATASAAALDLATGEQALAWMRTERANLIACTKYATATAQHARAIRITAALAALLRLQGPLNEAIALHQTAAATARRTGDRVGEAGAVRALGRARYLTGNYPAAADLFQHALELYQTLGDPHGEAGVLRDLGRVRYLTGNYPAAADLLQQAQRLYHTLGHRYGEAMALRALGWVHYLTGDVLTAASLLEQGLELFRALGSTYNTAGALWELGWTRYLTSEYPAAAELARQALDLYRTLGNRLGEAAALWELSRIWILMGRYEAGADLAQEALDLYRTLGDRLGEAGALWELGRVRLATGDVAAGAELCQRALDLFRVIGNRYGEAGALHDLGRAQHLSGDLPAAANLLKRSRALFKSVGDRQGEAGVLNSTGALLAESAGPGEALAMYEEALLLARQAGSLVAEARALEGTARCKSRTGDRQAAVADLREAVSIYQRISAAEAPAAAEYLAALETEQPEETTALESTDS